MLDLAIRLGELLIASGAAANDAIVRVVRLCAAYSLRTVYVDVTATGISVSYHRGYEREPLTNIRTGIVAVGALQDAIDEFSLTAAARLVEALMLTAGIVVGIVFGLKTAAAVGIHVPVSNTALPYGPAWMQLVGATLVAAMYGVETHSSWRAFLSSGICGLLGWVVHLAMHRLGTRRRR